MARTQHDTVECVAYNGNIIVVNRHDWDRGAYPELKLQEAPKAKPKAKRKGRGKAS